MMHVRSARDRQHDRRAGVDAWLSFAPKTQRDSLSGGIGALQALDEYRLPPGGNVQLGATSDAEVITFVSEGALLVEDSAGGTGVILAGEIQRATSGSASHRSESNASTTEWAHYYRICLRSSEAGHGGGSEQKRFGTADCRGRLCVVASPDGRSGSLQLHQSAVIYTALLDRGRHIVHELLHGRRAWLQVLSGAVTLGETLLAAGDGAGITAERVVALTARENAAILLLDLDEPPPARADRSDAAIFGQLWVGLSDVLGTAATATVVGRAARRATPRSPELGELAISRVEREYRYVVPHTFERAQGPSGPLSELLGELRPLLEELTGPVVLRRLARVPELNAWASGSPPQRS